jgi:uncharacterized protein involved in outer membrane biogenesis
VKPRSALWIVLAVLLAAVVGGVIFALENVNAYLRSQKPFVEKTASNLLNREVRFDDIGVSFAGGLGIRLSNPRVGEDAAYSEEAFLAADAIEVTIGIRAALDGDVDIRTVDLVTPVLRLHHLPSGWNFDSLGRSTDDRESEPADELDDEPDARDIVISFLQATNGTVFYTNRLGDVPYTIEATRIEMSAEEWRPGQPFTFDGKAVLHGADSHNTHVSASIHPKPSGPTQLDLEVKLVAHEAARIIELPPVAALVPEDVRASGPLHASLTLSGPTRALEFDARLDVGQVGITSEAVDKPPESLLDLRLRGKLHDDGPLEVAEFVVRGPQLTAQGSATLERSEPRTLDFQLRSDALPLNSLGLHRELVPPESREFEIFRKLQGSGTLTLAAGEKARGTLHLQSDSGFLRGVEYQQGAVDVTLSDGPMQARSRFGAGQVGPLPFSNLAFNLTLDGPRLQLDGGRAELLGGQFTAHGETVRRVGEVRQTSFSARLDGAQAERLDDALRADSKRNAEGKLSAYVDLNGSGSDWEELRSTLAANGAIKIDEGVLHQVNLAKGAVDAIMAIPGLASIFTRKARKQNPEVFDASRTEFEAIDIRFAVADGVAKTDDIEIKTTGYKILGRGEITLLGEVDANALLTFSESVTGKLGRSGKLLGGLTNPAGLLSIPVRLVGTLPNIETKADPAHITRAVGRGLLMDPVKGLMGGATSLFGRGAKEQQPEQP